MIDFFFPLRVWAKIQGAYYNGSTKLCPAKYDIFLHKYERTSLQSWYQTVMLLHIYVAGFMLYVERYTVHFVYLSCDFTSNPIKFLCSGVNEPENVYNFYRYKLNFPPTCSAF